MRDDYAAFIASKRHTGADAGFAPLWMPDYLMDFQVQLTDWAIRKGRAALLADCGLGKSVMELVWAFEQYYQGVRRCWRFGQKRTVRVDMVITECHAHRPCRGHGA